LLLTFVGDHSLTQMLAAKVGCSLHRIGRLLAG
jgi:hypothetical protein